jgi:hypothetical protein
MSRPDVGPTNVARDPARLEEIIEGFEAAWQAGGRPGLDAFLPADGPLRRAVLVEVVHADLECRLKAGEPARAEEYLRRYPELAATPDLLLDLVRREYELRCPREGPLPFDEYGQRFPLYRDALRRGWRTWSPPGPAGEVASAAASWPGWCPCGSGTGGTG